ncbi:MAG TPA: hypothetical protein PK625_05500, partial [Spirochaetales bacterium]|nr:hypothetical protein [Spirochaetales bacterium]
MSGCGLYCTGCDPSAQAPERRGIDSGADRADSGGMDDKRPGEARALVDRAAAIIDSDPDRGSA